jgi:capping protein alpha
MHSQSPSHSASQPASPSQLPLQSLSLTDNNHNSSSSSSNMEVDNLIESLVAQCPPGKEKDFHELISIIMPNKASKEASETEVDKDKEEDKEEDRLDDAEELTESDDDKEFDSLADSANSAPSALTEYVNEFFPIGSTLAYSPTAICLSALKLNPSNFWGVSWKSSWQPDAATSAWTGTVSVSAHFYEDGNVQLHASQHFKSGDSGPPVSIKDFIQRSEDSLQMNLNEAYQQLADVSFKRLRRQLPITRQKMDWGKYVNYKLSSELKS